MRVNLPVSMQEYPFPRGQTLVSTTDLKGRILYCNPMFIEVSGYTREELLGQPHNMIRHPDMPEEAYRDLWEVIASGQPWSAPIKNRRKNGDYYWVMANVTPLMEGDTPIGYMSVRTEATPEQTVAAEQLYATMRAEKAAGKQVHVLRAGRVVRLTPAGRLREALRLQMAGKLLLVALAVLGLGFCAALVGGQTFGVASTLAWIAALLLTGGIVTCAYRLAVLPLLRLVRLANRLAAGDLTQTVQVRHSGVVGDLQKALGQLNVNLLSIVRDARQESDKMRVVTGEIAEGNRDLSGRTESQASNLQQTAASMEQITGTVRQTADSAHQASELAGQATAMAERSSATVNDVAATMEQIQQASRRIGEITGLIDGIAFQTNILALNAAVEAARAGEQGRGFAVVAGEVRSLAQRSAEAAREIKTLVGSSVAAVDGGVRQVEDAGRAMQDIVASVQRVTGIIGEINSAAAEQTTGIGYANDSVGEIDRMTQQNAALVEQSAAAAASLREQAARLSQVVQQFRLADSAQAPAHVPAGDVPRLELA